MDKFKAEVIKALKKELKGISIEISLSEPPSPEMGDYAFACFPLSKEMKKAPNLIAEELAGKIKLSKCIKKVEVKGPYVNFFVSRAEVASSVLPEIIRQKEGYGRAKKAGKSVMVEFCSPNANKPLHLGHIRNLMLGEAASRILEAAGNKVIRSNLVNDRGVHICQSMYAYSKWGNGKEPGKKSDHFVGDFYVMFSKKAKESEALENNAKEMLKKWEEGDKETIALWKKMRKWALDGFEETYNSLGIKFDKYYYESEHWNLGKNIVMEGLKKGIFEKGESGEVIAKLEDYNLPNKVLLRADGTTVYMTQDIHLAKLKFEDYSLDQSIYVVASEQDNHFRQLFKILELMKFKDWKKCHHMSYGMVHLPEGRMKSREGTVVDADELIAEMAKLAKSEIKRRHKELPNDEIYRRADKIGLGALKFHMLRIDHSRDMVYNPEESISFEGETGPYIQYAHARCCSLLKKSPEKEITKVEFSLLKHPKEAAVISILGKYPETVQESASSLKPVLVSRFLLELARAFSEFYEACPILTEDSATARARLLVAECTRQVISNGLELLGIEAPEEM